MDHFPIKFRLEQCKLLDSLLIEGFTVPSVFVYGHTGTGKTLCVKSVVERKKKMKLIHLHCAEYYTPKLIYEHVLSSLQLDAKCDDMNLFVALLKKAIDIDGPTVYLLFEKAERLRDLAVNVLPAMLRLSELTDRRICVILESELVWEMFRQFPTGTVEPLTIHFPTYSKEDIVDILSTDCPAETNYDFYRDYCSLIVNVFFVATRNLRELRYMAKSNYSKYREPIEAGEVSESNIKALWKLIQPQLKAAMSSVYLHEISSRQWERAQCEDDGAVIRLESHGKQTIELPYFSKYLLIAAYLASYNPAKSDKKFFVKNAGRMRKTASSMKKDERTSNQLLGPKQFQLDRLMAIFYSIVEGKVHPTTQIYTQISNLVSLQLISRIGNDIQLDNPKYKCLVSLEFIQNIARTVQFDVVHYLYDFN